MDRPESLIDTDLLLTLSSDRPTTRSKVRLCRRGRCTNKEAATRSMLVKWTLRAGLGSVLLLGLPSFPFAGTDTSPVRAAEQADLLDINTASAEQLKVLHLMTRAGDFGVGLPQEQRELSIQVVKRTKMRGNG